MSDDTPKKGGLLGAAAAAADKAKRAAAGAVRSAKSAGGKLGSAARGQSGGASGSKGAGEKKSAPGAQKAGPDGSDLFFDEVVEELQRERAYALFRRYGPIAAALIVAVVLGASINEYLKSAAVSSAREAGGALLSAGAEADPRSAAEAYAARAAELEGGPAMLARMFEGALRAEAGDAAAPEVFENAAALASAEEEPIYADAAVLRAALAAFETRSPEDTIAALSQLAEEGRPFRPLALELLGLAEIKAGRPAEAKTRLEAAFAAWGDAPEARRRVGALLEGVGVAGEQLEGGDTGAEAPETAPEASAGESG